MHRLKFGLELAISLFVAVVGIFLAMIGFLSLGYTTRNIRIEATDFDVYKAEAPAAH